MADIQPRGLIIRPPKPEDYIFGDQKLGDSPINPTGQWTDWLPIPQDQNFAIEPECCTTMGTLAAVEILIKKLYGETDFYSKRFLAYASGTTQEGNDPNTVAETLRKKGDVPENDWPYTSEDNTWATFYETPPQSLYVKALEFCAEFSFGHSWVATDAKTLMSALTYSPLGVGGFAWAQDENGLYYTPQGALPCHWFALVGYVENQYWLVWDSYSPELKKLRWDYQFAIAKKYTLMRQVVNETAWTKFLTFMQQIIDGLQNTLGMGRFGHTFGAARSPLWPKVEREFLQRNPTCAVCGGKKKLTVHHIHPVHIPEFSKYELCPVLPDGTPNLITLCEGNPTINCHIKFGHWGNFRTKWNPNVVKDSAEWIKKFTAATEEEAINNSSS